MYACPRQSHVVFEAAFRVWRSSSSPLPAPSGAVRRYRRALFIAAEDEGRALCWRTCGISRNCDYYQVNMGIVSIKGPTGVSRRLPKTVCPPQRICSLLHVPSYQLSKNITIVFQQLAEWFLRAAAIQRYKSKTDVSKEGRQKLESAWLPTMHASLALLVRWLLSGWPDIYRTLPHTIRGILFYTVRTYR